MKRRTIIGSVMQALGAVGVVAGVFLLTGLAVTLVVAGAGVLAFGVLHEAGRV